MPPEATTLQVLARKLGEHGGGLIQPNLSFPVRFLILVVLFFIWLYISKALAQTMIRDDSQERRKNSAVSAAFILGWGLAFFYPFPIGSWSGFLARDLLFHLGFPGIPLLFFSWKIFSNILPQEEVGEYETVEKTPVAGKIRLMALASLILFLFYFPRTIADVKDFASFPNAQIDVLKKHAEAPWGLWGNSRVRFEYAGELTLPDGAIMSEYKPGEFYRIVYGANSRLLLSANPGER